jgi:hypothetical protein
MNRLFKNKKQLKINGTSHAQVQEKFHMPMDSVATTSEWHDK